MVDGNGTLLPAQLNSTYIFNRTTDQNAAYRPITLNKLDDVVAAALADGKGRVYTDAEKLAARTRLGVDTAITNATSTKQDTITDLDTIRSGAALGATALQSFTETDPTVPAWAKEANKPTYTADEINATYRSGDQEVTLNLQDSTQVMMKYLERTIGAMSDGSLAPAGKIWMTDGVMADWRDKPTYTAEEVGALPDTYTFTETDPTVPDWAKQETKPSYSGSEITLNGEGFSNVQEFSDGMYSALGTVYGVYGDGTMPPEGSLWGMTDYGVADWMDKPTYTASEVGALPSTTTHLSGDIATSEKGAANGVATLDANGFVPSSQLPSYVDDVLEYANKASFPTTGESGKVYIDTTTNITYRWSGSTYVPIGSDLALGETSSTAYAGDKGKAVTDAFNTHKADTVAHITAAERTAWNAKSNFSGDYNDLSNKPIIPTVPTNVSAFTNDANYVKNTDLAAVNKPGLVSAGNWLTVNQTTGKMEAGELTKAQYDSADGKIFVGKTTLNNVLTTKQDTISDLSTIRSNASAGKTAKDTIDGYGDIVTHNASEFLTEHQDISGKQDSLSPTQMLAVNSGITSAKVTTYDGYASTIASKANSADLATVATSGNYNDLTDKPTIPSAVTESTVSGWGFTKNTGTYSKPSTGIPKTDLASAVQSSLDKADTALQTHQDISGKANQTDLTNHTSDTNLHITETSRGNIETLFDTSHIIPKTVSPVDDEFSLTSRNPVENRVITPRVNLISNPNLLINGWFTVNQRNITTWEGGGYGVDRWKLATASSGVISDGVPTITVTSDAVMGIYQNNLISEKNILGKTVTLSAKTEHGYMSFTKDIPNEVGTNQTYDSDVVNGIKLRIIINTAGLFQCGLVVMAANTSVTVYAMKLEYGATSTLAADHAPDYATELLKCQRYYLQISSKNNTLPFICVGIGNESVNVACHMKFPTVMRTTPTISVNHLRVNYGNSVYNVVGFGQVNAFSGDSCNFNVVAQAAITAGRFILLQCADGAGVISFSAEL